MIPGIVVGQFTHSSDVPTTIGAVFGGGFYIGDITVGSNVYAVIMAGSDGQSPTKLQAKTSSTGTGGTSSLVDGYSNTSAMVIAGSHPAANYCNDYLGGGFDDWYLPAKNELNLAWIGRASLSSLSMSGDFYWSSSEYSTYYQSHQSFLIGSQGAPAKNTTQHVRPVRRVIRL